VVPVPWSHPMSTPGTVIGSSTPGDQLLSLLRQIRLTRREQQIVLAVLLAPEPLTALAVAKRTRLHYSHTKAVVRTLIAWGILTRTPEGLRFQPDPSNWGPPPVPPHGEERTSP
jgi:hypothetical protein